MKNYYATTTLSSFAQPKVEQIIEALDFYISDPSRCGHDGTQCRYLTDSGKRCVAGRMLTDEGIKKVAMSMENVVTLFRDQRVAQEILPEWEWIKDDKIVVKYLQKCHDALATKQPLGPMKFALDELRTSMEHFTHTVDIPYNHVTHRVLGHRHIGSNGPSGNTIPSDYDLSAGIRIHSPSTSEGWELYANYFNLTSWTLYTA